MNHPIRFRQLSDQDLLRAVTQQPGEVLTYAQMIERYYQLTRQRKKQGTGKQNTNNEPIPF